MAVAVFPSDVRRALEPWLGQTLTAELPDRLAKQMRTFLPAEDKLDALSKQVESILFNFIYDASNGTMKLEISPGRLVRILREDVTVMADDAMYVLFSSLPADENHRRLLNGYGTSRQSLSSLRALYCRFAACMSPEEHEFIGQMIRAVYPPQRYAWWMDNAGGD